MRAVGQWEVVGAEEKLEGMTHPRGTKHAAPVDFQEKAVIWTFVCWLNLENRPVQAK